MLPKQYKLFLLVYMGANQVLFFVNVFLIGCMHLLDRWILLCILSWWIWGLSLERLFRPTFMSFQATNLHTGQPNKTHCVRLICHEMECGNEFHLYGTEGIGSRFLSHQGDCIQRLFHLFYAMNSNKSETTAATVPTGKNDNSKIHHFKSLEVAACSNLAKFKN